MELLLLFVEFLLDLRPVLVYLNPFLLFLLLDKLLDVPQCLIVDLLLFFERLVFLVEQLAYHRLLLLEVRCQTVAAVGDVGFD